MPPRPDSTTITVACHWEDYSASQLARAVEDSDAHLLNLNVTDLHLDDGRITIELRTNRATAASTVRSLERYGFEVLSDNSDNPDNSDNLEESLRLRAAEILHIINI